MPISKVCCPFRQGVRAMRMGRLDPFRNSWPASDLILGAGTPWWRLRCREVFFCPSAPSSLSSALYPLPSWSHKHSTSTLAFWWAMLLVSFSSVKGGRSVIQVQPFSFLAPGAQHLCKWQHSGFAGAAAGQETRVCPVGLHEPGLGCTAYCTMGRRGRHCWIACAVFCLVSLLIPSFLFLLIVSPGK